MTTVHTATGHTERHTHRGRSALHQPARTIHQPARTIVHLHGDLDIATAPALRERLIGALRPGSRLLILDLSAVSFCDAAGLAVLIGTQRRAALLGITLRLAAPRPLTAKVLRITGLDRSLTIHSTLPDALAQPGDAQHHLSAGGQAGPLQSPNPPTIQDHADYVRRHDIGPGPRSHSTDEP